MKNLRIQIALLAVPLTLLASCVSFPDAESTRNLGEQMVSTAYPGMPAALTSRSKQDKSQMLCSGSATSAVPAATAAEISNAERATIKYPASGKLMGDWKTGEKLALDGVGMRIRGGHVEKAKENGANCYACHALDPKEVNAGNIGPSLAGYGAKRGNSEAVIKYTYEKIYDAWAYFPCSNMPRMGHNGFLTPEQITHVVAYLVDPASPVNR
jgi:sulfur-oxidizing protein SoxX